MRRILSTYRYIHQPLTAGLLAEIGHAKIDAIEVFCAPSHFNYRDEQKIRELARPLANIISNFTLFTRRLSAIWLPAAKAASPSRFPMSSASVASMPSTK